jgi:hypothetical protein
MEDSARTMADGDLDDAGRRRFWIMKLLLERIANEHPGEALELAFRIERFIHTGQSHGERASQSSATAAAVVRPDPPAAPSGSTTAAQQSAAVRAPNSPPPSSRPRIPLLASEAREQFAALAATGVDNRVLAGRFHVSVRQAHAIRLSLARQRPEVRPAWSASKPRAVGSALSREEELELEAEFLRQRKPPPCTIDDVIRFLRQRGDSVVTHEGGYLVNERLILATNQLIERANRYRERIGAPAFEIKTDDTNRSSHDAGKESYAMTG